MIEIKKNENESTINLIRRFTKKVQGSGILKRVRQRQFRKRPKSELQKKEEAIKKTKIKKRMDYLRKLGKIE
jgi:ribosomal protein S21